MSELSDLVAELERNTKRFQADMRRVCGVAYTTEASMSKRKKDCVSEAPIRRVYAAELKERLGCGDTWLRTMEKRGDIPPGRQEPGARRKWWLSDEADAIVAGTWKSSSTSKHG